MKIFWTSILMFFCMQHLSYGFTPLDSRQDSIIQGAYWPRTSFDFYLDKDNELPLVNNEETVIRNALNEWTDLETSYIVLNVVGTATRTQAETEGSGVDFFIYFDEDGSMTEELTGTPNSILGLAYSTANTKGEYVKSLVILNGLTIDSEEVLRTTVIHEIGHFLGLDHSTFYYENSAISFMYPQDNDNIVDLVQDDISGMSSIYPEESFSSQFGAITGNISFVDGAPLFGADIVAIDAVTLKPVMSASVGFPSCFGNSYTQAPGDFILPGLPAGNYYLKVESYPIFGGLSSGGVFLIEDEAISDNGSGVGIYDFFNFIEGIPTRYYPESPTINNGKMISVEAGKVANAAMNIAFQYNPGALISLYHTRPADLDISIAIGASTSGPYDYSKKVELSDPDGDGFVNAEVDMKEAEAFLPPSSNKKIFLLYRDTVANGLDGALLGFSVYFNKTVYFKQITSTDAYISFSRSASTMSIDGSNSYSTEKFSRDIGFDARCNSPQGTTNVGGVYYPLHGETSQDDDLPPNENTPKDPASAGSSPSSNTSSGESSDTTTVVNPEISGNETSGGCMLVTQRASDNEIVILILLCMFVLTRIRNSSFNGGVRE